MPRVDTDSNDECCSETGEVHVVVNRAADDCVDSGERTDLFFDVNAWNEDR